MTFGNTKTNILGYTNSSHMTQKNGEENTELDEQDEAQKTPDMKKFEEETGLRSIWRGVVTETYNKWSKGEKVYTREKERIALYVSEDDKQKWQEFIDKQESMTLSKLIRTSVNFYINFQPRIPAL